MDFPRLVFISPGPAKCEGGTYGYEVVKDKAEMDASIKAGFSLSVPEALVALTKVKKLEVAPK